MADPRSNRRRTILILLVLASITFITLDTRGGDKGIGGRIRNTARDAFAPVQSGVDDLLSPIGDWWDGVTRAGDIKDENRRLRRELQAARGRDHAASAALKENAALKRTANLPFALNIPAVDAQIILGSPGNFESTVGLNKGTDDGVGIDMAVVSGDGLIGRVSQVSRRRSTVLLLADRDSGVSVRDAQSGALGVINGNPDAPRQTVDAQDAKPAMKSGDVLVTVGSEAGPFPPDVPVGRVVSVTSRPGDLSSRVVVALYADATRTEFVRVLQFPKP